MSEDMKLLILAIIMIPLFLMTVYHMVFSFLYFVFGDYFLKFLHNRCEKCKSRNFETKEEIKKYMDFGFFDDEYIAERTYYDIVCKKCGHIVSSSRKKRY